MYFDKITDYLVVIASTAITVLVTAVWGVLAVMLITGIVYNLTN